MYGDQLVEFDGRYSSLLDQVDLPKGKFNGLLTLDRNNVLCMKTIIIFTKPDSQLPMGLIDCTETLNR